MAQQQRQRRTTIRTYTNHASGKKTVGQATRGKSEAAKTPAKKTPAKRTSGKSTAGRSSNNNRSHSSSNQGRHTYSASTGENGNGYDVIPELKKGDIRIVPLGGVEEVGRNMTVIEYGDDIIISDMGFEFSSDEDTPGIDYLIPNTKYLEDRLDKIKAIVITHGHLDHIGGVPFMAERLGNPPMYTRELTSIMIKKRQAEFPHLPAPDLRVVEPGESVTLKDTKLHFFPVTHSIPDSMGLCIETEHGNIVVSGDLKLDHDEGKPAEHEEKTWGEIGKQKNLMLIADSTNAEQPGFSVTERVVHENIEKIIKDTKGRLIIGLFASQFARMIKIIQFCEKYDKKVVTEGRSIKNNIEIGQQAGIVNPNKGTLISVQEIDKYPADKIVILATGAQGEEFAALNRIATKKHKFVTLNDRDTILLSSSVIPGNEVSVQRLKDNLYRHTSNIVHYRTSEVHTSGHGNQGELVWIANQVKPSFYMPAYGYHSMLKSHAKAIYTDGIVKKENVVVPDNGTIVELRDKGAKMVVLKEKAPSAPRTVDGFTIGDIQDVVIRDRQMLAQDGMFVIIATINLKTGKLRKSPDIISRGFVYLRESQDLLQQSRLLIKKTVEETTEGMNPINFDYVKNTLTETTATFLFQKTNKHPIVIPVLLGV